MSWFDLLKNIQIAGQRTSSKNYVLPDNEDDECFKYFYDLVKLMHPDFELQRQNYPDNIQGEDYWCRVKDTGWRKISDGPFNESWAIGEDVIEPNYAELMLYYHKVGYEGDNYTAIVIQIPETQDVDIVEQTFAVYSSDKEGLLGIDNKRRVDNIKEIWKKMQQHMRSL